MLHKNLTVQQQIMVEKALKQILLLSEQQTLTLYSAMQLWLQSRRYAVSDWCREALKKECS